MESPKRRRKRVLHDPIAAEKPFVFENGRVPPRFRLPITKYEIAKVVASRCTALSKGYGGDIRIVLGDENTALAIAMREFKERKLDDAVIRRHYPGGKYILWRLGDLLDLHRDPTFHWTYILPEAPKALVGFSPFSLPSYEKSSPDGMSLSNGRSPSNGKKTSPAYAPSSPQESLPVSPVYTPSSPRGLLSTEVVPPEGEECPSPSYCPNSPSYVVFQRFLDDRRSH